MTDYRTMFDKENLGSWDLGGKEHVVTIETVKPGKVGRGAQESRKPILSFVGKKKKMPCNVTNAQTIARLYGNDTRVWVGKKITIYGTVCMFGKDEVDCIRIRPRAPNGAAQTEDFPEADPAEKERIMAAHERASGREAAASGADEERARRVAAGEDPDA